MKCFYHGKDLDGHLSGAIVKNIYPKCEMHPVNYGDSIRQFDIRKDEFVFVVDFSFPMSEMFELNSKTKLIWIDHHKSAIEDANNQWFEAKSGLLATDKAACQLVFEYFYQNSDTFFKRETPIVVELTGKYDIWDHKDKRCLPLHYGILSMETDPQTSLGIKTWEYLLTMSEENQQLQKIIENGNVILNFIDKNNAVYAKEFCYIKYIEKIKMNVLLVNIGLSNSKIFDFYKNENYDAMIKFCYNNKSKNWNCSVYSAKYDCSKIARAFSQTGGGHFGAAGFSLSTDDLIKNLL